MWAASYRTDFIPEDSVFAHLLWVVLKILVSERIISIFFFKFTRSTIYRLEGSRFRAFLARSRLYSPFGLRETRFFYARLRTPDIPRQSRMIRGV